MTTNTNHLWTALWFSCLILLTLEVPLGATEKAPDSERKTEEKISQAADQLKPEPAVTPPFATAVTATEIQFPGLTIDRKTHEIRMDATVCLDGGILEYLVCLTGTFEHESIFVTKVKPEILHAALLLTGLEPTPMIPELEDQWWSKALQAEKSRVGIDVEWESDGYAKRVNVITMIRKNFGDPKDMFLHGTPPPENSQLDEDADAWVFSGSFIRALENGEHIYETNRSGVVIGIWRNPSAVIQYGIKTENPYRGKNQGMAVNESSVPGEGTSVELIIYKYDPLESTF
jgi:hypothetical protein